MSNQNGTTDKKSRAAWASFSGNRSLILSHIQRGLLIFSYMMIAIFGYIALSSYFVIIMEMVGKIDQLYLYPYDWPDTIFFTRLVSEGLFFTNPVSGFIASGSMAGLFPPLFHVFAFLVNLAFNNMNLTLVFISISLSFALAYLILKDWHDWRLRVLLFCFIFLPPFQYGLFPFPSRLRVLLALLFLVLMFKNPLKMDRVKCFLLFGTLIVLSQPLIAIMGIAAYFFIDSADKKFRLERRMLAPLALLVAIFVSVYSGHLYYKFLSPPASNGGFEVVACSIEAMYIIFSFTPWMFLFYCIVVPFFLLFLPSRDLKILFLIFIATIAFGGLLRVFPSLLIKVLSIFGEDLCMPLSPYIAFFAIFPPGRGAIPGKLVSTFVVASLAVMMFLQASVLYHYDIGYKLRKTYEELALSFQPHTTVLSMRLFFLEDTKKVYFESFDFRLMSIMYLAGMPNTFYYSPMQQFYDTENLLPAVKKFVDSLSSTNASECSDAADFLGNRTDYLHISPSFPNMHNYSWSYNQSKRLANKSFLNSCGVDLIMPNEAYFENSKSNESYLQYVFHFRKQAG